MAVMNTKTDTKDFSQGSIASNVLRIAFPMMVAELVHILYNLVDRMYIGHIPDVGTASLTGMGICLPLITATGAFANLGSTGGSPLCAIARGEGNAKKAQEIQETAFTLLLLFGAVLTVILLLFQKPFLAWLGGDAETLPFALDYFGVYVWGTVFSIISLGMNPFINMQGFPRMGMGTVLLGAVINIVLDPLFIFVFHMGVKGAAVATVISQAASFIWVIAFFTGKKALIPVRRLRLDREYLRQIFSLGVTGFLFKLTNSVTQAVCNITLKAWGGAMSTLYIGAMSVTVSFKEFAILPVNGITNGSMPVMSYNYGAKRFDRTRETINFLTWSLLVLNTAVFLLMQFAPAACARLFSSDEDLITTCVPCMRAFFAAYFFMALQTSGQNTFVALNRPKYAVFFSLFRKLALITVLTITLPYTRLGVMGVFAAEPISEIIGGSAAYITMRLTIYRELKKKETGLQA